MPLDMHSFFQMTPIQTVLERTFVIPNVLRYISNTGELRSVSSVWCYIEHSSAGDRLFADQDIPKGSLITGYGGNYCTPNILYYNMS